MTNTELRKLAILVLDDADGINEEAYNCILDHLSQEAVNIDIINMVEATEGRFYLPEDHGLVA